MSRSSTYAQSASVFAGKTQTFDGFCVPAPTTTPFTTKLQIFRKEASSSSTLVNDSEDGEEFDFWTNRYCDHHPQSRNPLCETCNTVNNAIHALEIYHESIQAQAGHHLRSARHIIPELLLDGMKDNVNQVSSTDIPHPTADPETIPASPNFATKQFRKHARLFHFWCDQLNVHAESVWKEWLCQEERKMGLMWYLNGGRGYREWSAKMEKGLGFDVSSARKRSVRKREWDVSDSGRCRGDDSGDGGRKRQKIMLETTVEEVGEEVLGHTAEEIEL